jgi:N-acyl-D-aspartate/D-glutamate deacylase
MDFTLRSPYTFEGLAAWQAALPLKGEAYAAKLADPAFRQAVKDEIARPAHFRLFNGEWDKVQVVESARPECEQHTVAALAREARRDPLDFMLDLALAEDLDTVFNALLLNSDEEAVGRMLRDPCSLVSLSDAGAHLTFFNDAAFGLHLLGHWSRERGVLTLPEAAWRLTGHPARVFGIRERGALKPGYFADLLLFDPATVNRGPNRRVFDLPASQPRTAAGRGPARKGTPRFRAVALARHPRAECRIRTTRICVVSGRHQSLRYGNASVPLQTLSRRYGSCVKGPAVLSSTTLGAESATERRVFP